MELERSTFYGDQKETLDALLAGSEGKDPFGKDGLLDELKKVLAGAGS